MSNPWQQPETPANPPTWPSAQPPAPPAGPYGGPGPYGPSGPYGQAGPYGPPGSGYGYPPPYAAPPAVPPGTNGMAVASLVLSLVWICGLGSILAVIFGHIGLRQTNRTGQAGRGLAIAGLIIGYLGVATLVGWFALVIAVGGSEAAPLVGG